jgi:hypothetical protein
MNSLKLPRMVVMSIVIIRGEGDGEGEGIIIIRSNEMKIKVREYVKEKTLESRNKIKINDKMKEVLMHFFK